MQLYKHILVLIECSIVDEVIIEHVIPLSIQNDSKITLLHVVHAHTLDQNRSMHEEAREKITKYVNRFLEKGIVVEVKYLHGEPEVQILKEINNSDYDLITMATHGHSFLGDILFGSVSQKLKHKINIPLLLIRTK